jgi:hypothetical protein
MNYNFGSFDLCRKSEGIIQLPMLFSQMQFTALISILLGCIIFLSMLAFSNGAGVFINHSLPGGWFD